VTHGSVRVERSAAAVRRASVVVAVIAAWASAHAVRAERARPGETIVLHHGRDPAVPSAMPGGPHHDQRVARPWPRTAPATRSTVVVPGGRPRGPAVDALGRLFVGTGTGLLVLSEDGAPIADVAIGPLDAAPVLVPGGDVIAASRNGLFARVAPDGSVRARSATDLGVRFAPLVCEDGTLAVVGSSRIVAGLDGALATRFQIELADGLALSPTELPSGHWAIAAGAQLAVIDPRQGALVRTITLPQRAAAPPLVDDEGTLWVATVDGALVAIRHESRITRTLSLGGHLLEPGAADRSFLALAPDGDLLVAVPTRGLVRLAPDGTERWSLATDTPPVPALAIDPEGRTAIADRVGHLSIVSPDGAIEWTTMLDSIVLAAPIPTARGRLVVATERGIVLLGPS
jgi:outer membrane protein assembly factor BamB